jgi:putative tricarboxylic transport membrane protein
MNRDLVFGSATLAVAAVYYSLTSTIPQSQLADPIGPQGLPTTYAIVLAVLSIVLIARSLRTANREPENHEPSNPEPTNHRIPAPGSRLPRVLGMLLIGVAYIIVVPYLGYLVSVAMLITATTYFQGGQVNGRTLVVALSGAALFWVLFIWLLRIQYPAGLWPTLI